MKKHLFPFVLIALKVLILVAESPAQVGPKVDAFLNRINSAPDSAHSSIVDSFMTTIPSFPFIEEDSLVCFIYQGNAGTLKLILEPELIADMEMIRLHDTDFWYHLDKIESDAMLRYQFIVDGQTIIDPLNPISYEKPNSIVSLLKMPKYVDPPEIEYYPNIPHGEVQDTVLFSTNLNQDRTISVYTPPSYDSTLEDSYPVIVFNDGTGYINYCMAYNILDYLISEERIQPIIGVLVPPIDRVAEYALDDVDKYSAFIIDELLPYIDARYRTLQAPENRAVIGYSASGLFSTHIAFHNPDIFGLCAAQSPSFQAEQRYNEIINQPKSDIKIYVCWGTYEPIIQQATLPFIDYLIAKNYDAQWNEWHEGHGTQSFRAHVDNALEFLLPGSTSDVQVVKTLPIIFHLMQNYPNPFNPTTTIGYHISTPCEVVLNVTNILGQKVKTLVNEKKRIGVHYAKWDGKNEKGLQVSTGIYFYNLKAGTFAENRKMLFIR